MSYLATLQDSISGVNRRFPVNRRIYSFPPSFQNSDSVQIDNLIPRAGGEVVSGDGDSGASASFVAGDAPAWLSAEAKYKYQ